MINIFVTIENIIADVFYNSTSIENLNFVKDCSNYARMIKKNENHKFVSLAWCKTTIFSEITTLAFILTCTKFQLNWTFAKFYLNTFSPNHCSIQLIFFGIPSYWRYTTQLHMLRWPSSRIFVLFPKQLPKGSVS